MSIKSNIYKYKDYKDLLNSMVELGGRGVKHRLAEHCKCQDSYVTAVLKGSAHFSGEQLEAAARFFGLDETECQYLLLLLQENRAGTKSLKTVFQNMLRDFREVHDRLQKTLDIQEKLSPEDQAIYHSSWYFGAIHVLLSIPNYRTPRAIAARLGLSIHLVETVLAFLVRTGFAEKNVSGYTIKKNMVHLDRDSAFISQHHSNWRVRALRSLEVPSPEHFHYSGVVTLTRADFLKVKEVLVHALRDSIDVIRSSKEEEIAGMCIDFFYL